MSSDFSCQESICVPCKGVFHFIFNIKGTHQAPTSFPGTLFSSTTKEAEKRDPGN